MDIAPVAVLWGNLPLFDLTKNLIQCREYHMEHLYNWSKFGMSLRLACGGQISSPRPCVKESGEREGPPVKGFSLSFSFHYLHRNRKGGSLFDVTGQTSNQVTYRLLTQYKVAPYDIPYIVSKFQPNRAELDSPYDILLVQCPG
jgi:hypothetical protein